MRDMLRQLLRQLPSKTEMPELLVDISQTALSSGIATELFKPGAEVIKEGFYAEKPIQLKMLGTYHQFGHFISGVAALPRVVILTMHDVSLKPTDAKSVSGGLLQLEGTVSMRAGHASNPVRITALAVLFAALAGCTGGDSDLSEWVAAEKAKKGTPIP